MSVGLIISIIFITIFIVEIIYTPRFDLTSTNNLLLYYNDKNKGKGGRNYIKIW